MLRTWSPASLAGPQPKQTLAGAYRSWRLTRSDALVDGSRWGIMAGQSTRTGQGGGATVIVVSSPDHALHEPRWEVTGGREVPAFEVAARAASIEAAIDRDGGFERRAPRAYGEAPILAVHDPHLVAYLETAWPEWQRAGTGGDAILPDTLRHPALRPAGDGWPEPESPCGRVGYWTFDTASPILAGTWQATRAAVDVALTAAQAVLDGAPAAYGLCRPPGHHAARDLFGGYCYLNNAAIAAHWLTEQTSTRVAILDVDVHHGNGTQAIFWERPDVLYVSLHSDPRAMYPYYVGYADETGGGAGLGANLNLPLPAGSDDDRYLDTLDIAVDRIASFDAGTLVVSLGLDTYVLDPMGGFGLTTAGYAEMGRRVAALGRPTVVIQEGGYHIADLGTNVVAWLRGFAPGG
jgi:acetoin utilization deacetylase AcuC-like enzyme